MTVNNSSRIMNNEGIRELIRTFFEVTEKLPEAASINALHHKERGNIEQQLFKFLSGRIGESCTQSNQFDSTYLTTPNARDQIGEREKKPVVDVHEPRLDGNKCQRSLKNTAKGTSVYCGICYSAFTIESP